jgi:hypothetical protein
LYRRSKTAQRSLVKRPLVSTAHSVAVSTSSRPVLVPGEQAKTATCNLAPRSRAVAPITALLRSPDCECRASRPRDARVGRGASVRWHAIGLHVAPASDEERAPLAAPLHATRRQSGTVCSRQSCPVRTARPRDHRPPSIRAGQRAEPHRRRRAFPPPWVSAVPHRPGWRRSSRARVDREMPRG